MLASCQTSTGLVVEWTYDTHGLTLSLRVSLHVHMQLGLKLARPALTAAVVHSTSPLGAQKAVEVALGKGTARPRPALARLPVSHTGSFYCPGSSLFAANPT